MKYKERQQYGRYYSIKTKFQDIHDVFLNINKCIVELYEVKPFVYKFLKLCDIFPFINLHGQYNDMPYRLYYYRDINMNDYMQIDILYEQKFFEEL